VPGTADTSRTQRTTLDNLNIDTSDIPPAHNTFWQVTAPPAESASTYFQADDAGSIPVVRSTRKSRSGLISWPGLVYDYAQSTVRFAPDQPLPGTIVKAILDERAKEIRRPSTTQQ
jgi:hypothetical protein